MALFQLPTLHNWMLWDSHLIAGGQVWRIVTGNFTHTNLYHLGMNMAGLWLISYIFRAEFTIRTYTAVLLLLCLSVGSLLLLTSIQVYVGLSGVLHGLFGFYAIKEWRQGRKASLLLAIGLAVKITWEQCFGSPTGSEALIGAGVAINAHLFGSLTGLILALCFTHPAFVSTKKRLGIS
ncbi:MULTISPECIES: rhombosortase [Vibrio]|nr:MULTISPECIES: rhombosortase [Vibrio]